MQPAPTFYDIFVVLLKVEVTVGGKLLLVVLVSVVAETVVGGRP